MAGLAIAFAVREVAIGRNEPHEIEIQNTTAHKRVNEQIIERSIATVESCAVAAVAWLLSVPLSPTSVRSRP